MNENGAEVQAENYCQISDDDIDDDVEEFDDLDDDCLLEEVDPGSGGGSGAGAAGRLPLNAGRGPYERAWTTNATRALIHIRGPMEGRFTEGRQKRTALWLHCTRQMQKLGYRYSAAKVQKKWHNILITYNKNLGKKFTAGYVHWEFFEEMFKYLEGKRADCDGAASALLTVPDTQVAPPQPATVPPTLQQPQMPKLQQAPTLRQSDDAPRHLQQQQQPQPQPQLLPAPLEIDSRSNDDFDEEDDDSASTLSEPKAPKLEYHPPVGPPPADYANAGAALGEDSTATLAEEDAHAVWWRDYFERKLLVEREKLQVQRQMHNDQMQFSKLALVQQEKIERIKIDAINNLTGTLQKLVEVRGRKS